ncbi:MAG: hypothetical protein AAGE52_02835 [Myxococcota bacterium]
MNLATLFDPVRGRYGWGVRIGEGSLLRIELGPPTLEVDEAFVEGAHHRSVTVRGRWQLALLECSFSLMTAIGEVHEGSERDALFEAAEHLSGQALLDVIDEDPATRFTFDLGAELCVKPFEDGIQWVFAGPTMEVGRNSSGALVRLAS